MPFKPRIAPCRIVIVAGFLLAMSDLITIKLGYAKEIQIKFGSLGPAGTSVAVAVETFLDGLQNVGNHIGHTIKIRAYYGGVMGDEPEMNQKARLGQLDVVTPTVSTLPELVPSLEPYYLPFLVENFGEFDYLMRHGFLKAVTTEAYQKGFVVLGTMTEGMYDMYYRLDSPIHTPEKARGKLKAANWTGTPQDNIWRPLGIPQVPVSVPELPTYHKMGVVNADISPALWVIGVQLYTVRPMLTIVQPSFFTGGAGALLTRSKFEAIPWDFKIGVVGMLPMLMYVANGQLRDSHYAFVDAMVEYGVKKQTLSASETKAWKDPLVAYHETYLKNKPSMKKSYDMIRSILADYRKASSSEKAIYESDPEYKNFPKKLNAIAQALKDYIETGSLEKVAALEGERVIENWRILEPLKAAETLAQTGDASGLKAWTLKFLPDAIVEEAFSKHMDEMKKLYGSKEAIQTRAKEWLAYIESKKYKGYHKGAK
jgi:TRAP-type C4-dicarboxylate transport system substrate-binding protein